MDRLHFIDQEEIPWVMLPATLVAQMASLPKLETKKPWPDVFLAGAARLKEAGAPAFTKGYKVLSSESYWVDGTYIYGMRYTKSNVASGEAYIVGKRAVEIFSVCVAVDVFKCSPRKADRRRMPSEVPPPYGYTHIHTSAIGAIIVNPDFIVRL